MLLLIRFSVSGDEEPTKSHNKELCQASFPPLTMAVLILKGLGHAILGNFV